MKKLFSFFILISVLSGFMPNNVSAIKTDTNFVVTAYYSPLPGQKYYLTGDYVSEKRLNGQGIAGASGKKVFSGMLAAPKSYKFGTKIYLKGLGIGSVEDRGGAIVPAGVRGYSYDRIDVWVGSGDEGLRRAIYWGKRTIPGKVLDSSYISTLDLNVIPDPTWATKNLKSVSDIFHKGLGIGSDQSSVKELQKFLSKIGLYDGELDGIYSSKIIDIIYDFQVENGILNKGDLYGAGYWGNKTRSLFLKKYLEGSFDKKEDVQIVEQEKNVEIEVIENTIDEDENIENIYEGLFLGFGRSTQENLLLQELLIEMNLYKGEKTGNYSDLIDPIYDFQISQGIVKTPYDLGAGSFGPKTRAALNGMYDIHLVKQKEIKKEEERLEELKKQEAEKIRLEEKRKKDLEEKINSLKDLSIEHAEKEIASIGEPKQGEIGVHVRNLQNTLKDLGYFEYKDTAIFGPKTAQSIAQFQLDNDLIDSLESPYAGILGNRTKQSLKESIANKIFQEQIQVAGIQSNAS